VTNCNIHNNEIANISAQAIDVGYAGNTNNVNIYANNIHNISRGGILISSYNANASSAYMNVYNNIIWSTVNSTIGVYPGAGTLSNITFINNSTIGNIYLGAITAQFQI